MTADDVTLTDSVAIEARELAKEIVELLAERIPSVRPATQARPWTVREVARHYSVADSWVYAHWRELGGFKLGRGRSAPLRFDPNKLPPNRDTPDRAPEGRIDRSPTRRPVPTASRSSTPTPARTTTLTARPRL